MSSLLNTSDQTQLFLKFLDYITEEENYQTTVLLSTVAGTIIGSRFGNNSTWWGMVGGLVGGMVMSVYGPQIKKHIKDNLTETQKRELAVNMATVFGSLGFVAYNLNDIIKNFTLNDNVARQLLTEVAKYVLPLVMS